MKRSQANRSVIAARAAANGRTGGHHSVMPPHMPRLRTVMRRSKAVKMTATQKNSQGRTSEWARSPEFFTDPKWDRTVTGIQHGRRGV